MVLLPVSEANTFLILSAVLLLSQKSDKESSFHKSSFVLKNTAQQRHHPYKHFRHLHTQTVMELFSKL